MNDVLPKPFTKEGLISLLDKHLGHMKKNSGHMDMGNDHLANNRHSLKEEDSPGRSPATLSTHWNSPSNMSGVSPSAQSMPDEYVNSLRGHHNSYNMEMPYSAGPHTPGGQRIPPPPHRRHISDITGGEDSSGNVKRHQAYGPAQQSHQQMHLHSQR